MERIQISRNLLVKITRETWIQVFKARNPWLHRPDAEQTKNKWYNTRVLLSRALFELVFSDAIPTEELLIRAFDFLEGKIEALVDSQAISL